MVRGLEYFKTHFSELSDCYVLIGGTACSLAMEAAGLSFRSTKDLDIVLCVEVLNDKFLKAFWAFVRDGKYDNRQKSTGRRLFYRFFKPQDEAYPEMLELFSRKPDILDIADGSHLTPIPTDEEISSLSAILLDNDYYHFIHSGKQELEGLPVVAPTHLIPLKARAWLDLSGRKNAHSNDVNKHKNDVFKLYQLLNPTEAITLPDSVKTDFRKFLQAMKQETSLNLSDLGLRRITLSEALGVLREIYGIGDD